MVRMTRLRGLLLLALVLVVSGCSFVDMVVRRPLLTREQAIAAAAAAEPAWASEAVLNARLTTWGELGEPRVPVDGARPRDQDPVWVVNLGRDNGPMNGQGVLMVLDAHDGRVLASHDWIS